MQAFRFWFRVVGRLPPRKEYVQPSRAPVALKLISPSPSAGGSGTLAYTPPEAFLRVPSTGYYPPPDRTNDMWALGLILHLLVFFALPFAEAGSEGDTQKLEEEIKRYQG